MGEVQRLLGRRAVGWLFPCAAVTTGVVLAACGGGSGNNAGSAFQMLDGGADSTVSDGGGGGLSFDTGAGSGSSGGGSSSGGSGGGDAGISSGSNNCVAPTALTLGPPNKVASVSVGAPYTLSYTVTASYASGPDADVTASAFFTSSDTGLGTFSSANFT